MLYATNIFPGDGSTRQFEITFVGGYLNKSHVKVYVEDAVTKLRSPIDMGTVTWLGPYTIQVPAATPVGSNTVVARKTPLIPIVNFQGSSRITEANLDVAHRQGLFVATESLDNTNSQVVTELKEAILNSATWAESAEVSAAQALARANIATTQAMVADSKASEAATSASEAATLVGALALPTGSAGVGHIAAGAGAVATDVQAGLRREHFITDYTSTATAIAAAIASGFKLLVNNSTTIRIPTDAANLQTAVDYLAPNNQQTTITLNIESGHAPQTGCTVLDGDYSQFKITSTATEVTLSPTFGLSSAPFVRGENAKMPRLACLVNANSRTSQGYAAYYGSTGYINPNCGIKNAYGSGLEAYGASTVYAENTVWTGSATNNATGAGITSWGSIIYAGGADVSDSKYYGAQAAHGGILNIDTGHADRCFRYGFRGSDGGYISADAATANNCGIVGNPLAVGYGFYAFNNSLIAARDASATGCVSRGVVATGGSTIHVSGGTFTAAGETGCFAQAGSIIDATNANVSNCKKYGVWATVSSSIAADALTATGCGTGANDSAVFCEKASRVSVGVGNLSNCTGIAVRVENSSTVNAISATLTGAGNRAAFCSNASSLNVANATATGAGVEGIRVASGSNANIQSSNFQRGGSTAVTDIIVDNGSFINAAGATGGVSQTVNSMTAEGVIFR